jgi:hypothetical protein
MNSREFLRSKKFRIFLIIFVVAAVFLFIFLLAKLIALNSQCIQNPFVYAADSIVVTTEKLDLQGRVPDPFCSCSVGESIFYFDHEGIYKENPLLNTRLP